MSQRKYEMMMIIRPDILEKDLDGVFDAVRGHLKEVEATITLEDVWGKRTLAYPIKKHEKGLYAVFYFDMDPLKLKALNHEMGLESDVLRHLVVKTPDNMDVIEYITVLREQANKDKENLEKELEEKRKAEPEKKAAARTAAKKSVKKEDEAVEVASTEKLKKDDKEIDAHVDSILGDLDDE